jgi:CubicO group peptidase (beta-lactamase class C family)
MRRNIFTSFLYIATFFILFAGCYSRAFTQSFDVGKLDSLLTTLSKHDLAMGSLTISKNGSILFERAFGSRLIERDKFWPSDVQTKYRIGSTTKMFTAVLILNMIEDGSLDMTTTLDQFFPELPNASRITIRDLLYHRSGLHDYTVDTNFFEEWIDKPKTHVEMLKIITDKGPDFEPNEKASYCNSNYLVLSYIVEQIQRKPYQQVVEENIISKIGLRNTYYGALTDNVKNESTSYKKGGGKWIKEMETNLTIHSGAGSLVSTPTDLVKFIEALFLGKLISKRSLSSMKSLVDDYGMGMFPFRFQDKTGFGHGGRIDGFASSLQYYPEDKITIAYCTNGIVYPKDDVLRGILSICFDKSYSIPQFERTKSRAGELSQYLGVYVSANMPISVTCKETEGVLVVETQGHEFSTRHIGSDAFMNLEFGFLFEFKPGELTLKEGDQMYSLKKVQ